jgi:RND family efflux transporter MFP subunit
MINKRVTRFVGFTMLLATFGCGGPETPTPTQPTGSPPAVSVVSPQRKSLKRVVEQPGTIMAYEETELFARLPGYVRLPRDTDGKLLSDIGHKVRGPKLDASGKEEEPGEVLAELMVPELEEEANQKRALVLQAQADVEQASKALAAATANITTTEAVVLEAKALQERWESESKRVAALAGRGILDLQVKDETMNQYKAAGAKVLATEAAVLKAKADRDKAQADEKSAKARIGVAQAEQRRLEALLTYSKIRAPYDGVLTRRKVNTGDFVQPGGKGEWLFTVARLDPVRVVVSVPEADADVVLDKGEVKLTIPALSNTAVSETITRTSWALEPGSRTLRAEIDLANKNGRLRPGMYVYARITGPLPEAWTLPTSAVVKQGDGMVCFLVQGGKTVRTPVQVGRVDGSLIEVHKWQKPGSTTWEPWTGQEVVAVKAAGS